MTIKLHNTKTRKKEIFVPIDADNVRMYVCGPTVYDRAHLGNARPVIVFDVLYRLLRHVYGAEHVTYVRNFTDVDDKINAEAQRRKAAGDPRSLEDLVHERTEETIDWYLRDMAALGNLEPNHMPRATQYIPQMIAMIEDLIDKDFAYVVRSGSNNPPEEYVIADREAMLERHALFQVEKYERYGQLSGQSTEEMIAGSRGEKAPGKRSPMDFVLWKPSTPDLPGWDSPWGRGRPGWHIECSAMAKALLGEKFDIHGGGRDLMFPHHENEIAQSCCANDTDEMARYWMHNEMLQVEGKKMSKSLGNFFTVRDLLEQGIPGEVIRFVFLSTHYRKPMDWTAEKARDAEKLLDSLIPFVDLAIETGLQPSERAVDLPRGVIEALKNDLDTHAALQATRHAGELVAGISRGEILGDATAASVAFLSALNVLGLYELMLKRGARRRNYAEEIDAVHLRVATTRAEAMASKDFSTFDKLKAALKDAGVEVRVKSKTEIELVPTPDFDPAKLEALK